MKKLNLLLGTIGLATVAIGIASCEVVKGVNTKKEETPTETQLVKSSTSVQALTGIKMLESNLGSPGLGKVSKAYAQSSLTVDIENVLPTIDTLMNNGSEVESVVSEEQNDVNGTIYNFKETLTYKDLNLESKTYTIFYNKLNSMTKVDEDETEVIDNYAGVIKLDETSIYEVSLITNSETEADEEETEREFKIKIDQTSYIKVEQEVEKELGKEEMGFSYTYVNQGRVVSEYSIEFENNAQGFSEVSYEVDGIEYEVKKVTRNNEELYLVEVEDDQDNEVKATYKKVTAEDGTVTFVRV